jgi:hypothetical protein
MEVLSWFPPGEGKKSPFPQRGEPGHRKRDAHRGVMCTLNDLPVFCLQNPIRMLNISRSLNLVFNSFIKMTLYYYFYQNGRIAFLSKWKCRISIEISLENFCKKKSEQHFHENGSKAFLSEWQNNISTKMAV